MNIKRKYPAVSVNARYPGPAEALDAVTMNPTGVRFWAHFSRSASSLEAPLVSVYRLQTVERDGTKRVEFRFAPTALLIDGTKVYPEGVDEKTPVWCGWSDFLRLIRWIKPLTEASAFNQASIARVIRDETAGRNSAMYKLVAVRPEESEEPAS